MVRSNPCFGAIGLDSHGLHGWIAHRTAWDKADILHRDISASNIMININPETPGSLEVLLNDWDLCQWKEDSLKSATQPAGRSVRVMSHPRLDSGLIVDI